MSRGRSRLSGRLASAGRTIAAAVLALAALLAGAPARAQAPTESYPTKPIRIIVPFAAGGSVEVVARLIGQYFTQAWGQQVIVETRPGGGTMIGTQAAARAEPDGYTLLVAVSNHATNPALHQKMPYDALEDFEFVSMLARAPVVIYANPKFPPADLKQLVTEAKQHPGALSFGRPAPAA